MINIDFLTLKAFLVENIDYLIGARLQKIQQPTRKDLILCLRNCAESRKLYINIDPKIYHITFMNSENENKRNIVIPKQPPMFCMLLRKYLEGCKISDCKVVDNERIFEIHFDTCDEFGQIRYLSLTTELMGKHSNIILYDRKTMEILGCAHNIGHDKSKYRELKGGLKYIYPPKLTNIPLSNELKLQFKNITAEKISEYLSTERYRPAIYDDRYTLFQELLPQSILQSTVCEMLDNYYSYFQGNYVIESKKNKLKTIADTKLKKINNSIYEIENTLAKRNNMEKYKLNGELLTSNMYLKADFQKSIELEDYINNKKILIELDENKTMKENAQKYFKLYSKSKKTKEISLKLLTDLKIKKEYIENIIYSIKASDNIAELEDIESEIAPSKTNKINNKNLTVMQTDILGFKVYIGKNNKQNDYIVSKLSKGEDYWFHIKSCAGSHVLLKIENTEPNENVLYECCKLAKAHSAASLSPKASVIYTKRKFVKKPIGAPLGYVIYKNEKEILV